MKKIKISEDLIPLSRREQTIIHLIIVCVFQFLLFFTPVLAAEAMAETNYSNDSDIVSLGFSSKNEADPLISSLIENQTLRQELSKNAVADIALAEIENKIIGPENTILPVNKEAAPKATVISSSFRTITAYNSLPEQTDDTPCITANGFDLCKHWTEDTIAANFLKFGTKVRIPELFGDRIFIVRDRMNKRFSDRVDVWFIDKQEARVFGKRTARIEIVEIVE